MAEGHLSSLPKFILKQRPNEDVIAWYLGPEHENEDKKWIAWNVSTKRLQTSKSIIRHELLAGVLR